MQINRITIENYGRLRYADIVPGAVTLFAGANESGKSSALEAVRFGLTGESPRVDRKKDFPALVSPAAKRGRIRVQYDDDHALDRDIATGSINEGYAAPCHEALPLLLGAQSLAAMKADDRRRSLLSILGASNDPADIRARLLERGHREGMIDQCLPLLHSGWAAAEEAAKNEATQAKGAWRQVTGEAYGTKKAEGWQAPDPADALEGDMPDVDALSEQLAENEEALSQAIKQQRDKGHRHQRTERLRLKRSQLSAEAKAIPEYSAEVDRARDNERAAEVAYDQARKAFMDASSVPCPSCETLLYMDDDGSLHAADQHASAVDGDKLQAAVNDARNRLDENRVVAREAVQKLKKAREAESELDQLPDDEPDDDEATDDSSSDRIATIRDDIAVIREKLAAAKMHLDAQRQKVEAEEKAAKLHRNITLWLDLAEAFGPGGLPAEILNEALAPITDRLRHTAQVTSWPLVSLDSDANILIGDMPYRLASESAQWRADAALAEAVAWVSGAKVLLLDRVDVLDMDNRGRFADWIAALAQEYDGQGSILCAGTFKAPPDIPPVSTVWLEGGEAHVGGRRAA